jgi:hypothetical protein
MKRNSAIATAVAVTGVIVAGSLAGVAMVTATAETSRPTQTLTVVASGQPDPQFVGAELPALDIEPAGPTSTSTPTSTNSESSESTASPKATTISEKSARAAVQNATEGKVTNVEKTEYNGVNAFAVTVSRPDGSIVTGYVDASTSIVFDWVVNREAPKATTSTYQDDDDHNDDDDDHNDDDDDHNDDDDDHDKDQDDD